MSIILGDAERRFVLFNQREHSGNGGVVVGSELDGRFAYSCIACMILKGRRRYERSCQSESVLGSLPRRSVTEIVVKGDMDVVSVTQGGL